MQHLLAENLCELKIIPPSHFLGRHTDPEIWPLTERFRVVETNPLRQAHPLDWMHEREWRIAGGLSLQQSEIPGFWWWPIVPDVSTAKRLMIHYGGSIHSAFALDVCKTIDFADAT